MKHFATLIHQAPNRCTPHINGSNVDAFLTVRSLYSALCDYSKITSGVAAIALFVLVLTGAARAEQVTISMPAREATVGTPFHLVGTAAASDRITGITVYVNGVKTASASGAKLDTYISAQPGRTRVTVQAFHHHQPFQKTIYVNVDATSTAKEVPAAAETSYPGQAKTIDAIEHMDGWKSCTVCAGPGGRGSVADYSMKRTTSPSRDGKSLQFNVAGNHPYSDALWWRQLGAQDNARHFVYDLQFYIKDPAAAQALEFDVNQSVGGKKFIFGTECSLGRGTWDIWAASKSWIQTSIPCGKPAAYTWHHVIWEFERTTGNKVRYVSVTLDGKKSYVNVEVAPKPSGVREMNVAFQMDGNRHQAPYSVWLDNVKLIYW